MEFEIVCKCGYTRPLNDDEVNATGHFVAWDILKDTLCPSCGKSGNLSMRIVGTELIVKKVDGNTVTFAEV